MFDLKFECLYVKDMGDDSIVCVVFGTVLGPLAS